LGIFDEPVRPLCSVLLTYLLFWLKAFRSFAFVLEAKIIITSNSEVKMDKKFRSSCPISSALDIVGDKWSLLIVRDMLLMTKKTFKELSLSDERIASGILASRLKQLESFGLITKRKLPGNQKENIYLLSEKGIDLAPIIIEFTLWGDRYMREFNPTILSVDAMKADKSTIIETVRNNYRSLVSQIIT
jgi:DNA-binding HxlR family transcriptional regulator